MTRNCSRRHLRYPRQIYRYVHYAWYAVVFNPFFEQDGYNVDILHESTGERTSTAHTVPLRSNSVTLYQDLESSRTALSPGKNIAESRKPWWRTVKGIAIIAVVVVVVVIAIVVPVAVTTSRNKSSSDQQAISPLSSSFSASSTPPSSTPISSSAASPSSTPPVDSQGSAGDGQSDSGVSSGKTEQGSSDDGAFDGSSPVSG